MKLFFDFFPLVLFYIVYKQADIYVATAVLMVATILQTVWLQYKNGKVETLQKLTLALILVFGSATILFHDERFIKWKPTVLYVGMSIALFIALFFFKKNFMKSLLGKQVDLSDDFWNKLNISWIIYFAFMGLLNAYVAENYTTEEWVAFKLWGYIFPLIFLIGQAIYIVKSMANKNRRD